MSKCQACAYCFLEPSDRNFTCGHRLAGAFGKHIYVATAPDGICGPDRKLFEQHPLRNADGTLKVR